MLCAMCAKFTSTVIFWVKVTVSFYLRWRNNLIFEISKFRRKRIYRPSQVCEWVMQSLNWISKSNTRYYKNILFLLQKSNSPLQIESLNLFWNLFARNQKFDSYLFSLSIFETGPWKVKLIQALDRWRYQLFEDTKERLRRIYRRLKVEFYIMKRHFEALDANVRQCIVL